MQALSDFRDVFYTGTVAFGDGPFLLCDLGM